MAPIYNPPEGASAFSSAVKWSNGYDYFTEEGFLNSSMDVLVSGDSTFPTYDTQRGQAATLVDSAYQFASGTTDPSWIGYDFDEMTEVLAVVYTQVSAAQYNYLHINKAVSNAAEDYQDGYFYGNVPATPRSIVYKYLDPTFSILAQDATIYGGTATAPVPSNPAFGMALHCKYDGTDSIVTYFIRLGTGQWVTIGTATDVAASSPHTSFQSVKLTGLGRSERYICPFYVWGS